MSSKLRQISKFFFCKVQFFNHEKKSDLYSNKFENKHDSDIYSSFENDKSVSSFSDNQYFTSDDEKQINQTNCEKKSNLTNHIYYILSNKKKISTDVYDINSI